MNWRSTQHFPLSKGGQWQVGKSGTTQPAIFGFAAVQKAIAKWHPLSPLLISSPHSIRLLPPLCVEEISTETHGRFLFRSRLSIHFLLLCAAICALAEQSNYASDGWQFAMLLVALALFLTCDYLTVLRDLDAARDRALFAAWIRATSRTDLMVWACTMLTAGAVQLACQSWLGGDAPTLERFGTTFSGLERGEYWRLLTGPFIHLDVVHWGGNAALAAFAGIIAAKISRSITALVFLFGSAAGAICTWLLGDPQFTSYVGVSAGVLAMLGLCAGVAWRNPDVFPINFCFTFISFGATNIFISWIYSPEAANAAHVVGMLVGIASGVIVRPINLAQIKQQ